MPWGKLSVRNSELFPGNIKVSSVLHVNFGCFFVKKWRLCAKLYSIEEDNVLIRIITRIDLLFIARPCDRELDVVCNAIDWDAGRSCRALIIRSSVGSEGLLNKKGPALFSLNGSALDFLFIQGDFLISCHLPCGYLYVCLTIYS